MKLTRPLKLGAIVIAAAGLAGVMHANGALDLSKLRRKPAEPARTEAPMPSVSVVKAARAHFRETVVVNGTLVPREEILVSPEIDGYRVLQVMADEGNRVRKGDTLASLDHTPLDAQLAQNDAAIARADASIAQASSAIAQADARVTEAKNALERARPLRTGGHISDATFDTREAAALTAKAALAAARDGLKAAEAEKAQAEAQRRELTWRRERTEVRAPADGIVSRRVARIGAQAAGAAEPMFRVIAKGEIELDAEVPEPHMARLREAQRARITVAGAAPADGTIRIVSPEIDRATRLGRVRIFIGEAAGLRIGAFARGVVTTGESEGIAVPVSAVQFSTEGASLQALSNNRVETRRVSTGLQADGLVEITKGLAEGDVVVARAGTFLRDGDNVRPVFPADSRVSEAN